jgi:uncharacterized protein YbbC (DUF1343 family)
MIRLGIERLPQYLPLFSGKRVGLITNPTGVDKDFETTIDKLQKSVNLVALFSPEHGVRGDIQAGVRLDDYIDPKTGCMVYSLYGKTKQPTKEMMDTIDLLVFDLQDVGARYYTYIYTLAYALKACAIHGKQMVVFDRPNPVGGVLVEGNLIKNEFASFVGNFHLPQRYGLTIGELATYINEEERIFAKLTVVPMIDYKREMMWDDTSIPWVMPSPNIPDSETPLYYLATCLFEGTNISEGRGTTKPFRIIGSPFLKSEEVIKSINQLPLTGFKMRTLYFTPTFSKHQGVLCSGIELYITDKHAFQPVKFGMSLLKIIEEKHQEFHFLPPYKASLKPMIDLLNGDDFLRLHTYSIDEIFAKIDEDSKRFVDTKRRYHLYE